MTRAEREAARARCAAATPGAVIRHETITLRPDGVFGRVTTVTVAEKSAPHHLHADFWGPNYDGRHDAALFVLARTDLPAALDELDHKDAVIDHLEGELAALRKEVAND
jgi:hypothetical protein